MAPLGCGDGGAVVLPLAEEVAASLGLWQVGDLVSVWSKSARSWNDGIVVATEVGDAAAPNAVSGAAALTVRLIDSNDGRTRQKDIREKHWRSVLRRRPERTRTPRSRTRSPEPPPRFLPPVVGVRFDWCAHTPPGAVCVRQCAHAAGSLITKFALDLPYYIGICLNLTDRWLLGRAPERHIDRYRAAIALVRAPSAFCKLVEAELISEHRRNGVCVNRAPGGGGLADGYPLAFVYVCVGGGTASGVEARDSRARHKAGCAGSLLCRDLGHCPHCDRYRGD